MAMTDAALAAWLRAAAEDPDLIEAARRKIEDVAIEMRDMSAFVIRANGIVVRDYD